MILLGFWPFAVVTYVDDKNSRSISHPFYSSRRNLEGLDDNFAIHLFSFHHMPFILTPRAMKWNTFGPAAFARLYWSFGWGDESTGRLCSIARECSLSGKCFSSFDGKCNEKILSSQERDRGVNWYCSTQKIFSGKSTYLVLDSKRSVIRSFP